MLTLRGGGCKPCTLSLQSNQASQVFPPTMPQDFQTKIRDLSAKIKDATLTSVDDKVTLMNCFQYFFYNERVFNNMMEYQELAKMNVDLLLEIVVVMMDSAKLFVKSNPLYCYYCMQITAWIWGTLLWFYTRNEKRFLTAEQQQGFMDLLNSIDQQLGIEAGNIYENSIKYEMFVIKTIITIFPINSKEAKELLKNLTLGAIASVTTLSLTDELKDALKCGAIFLVKEGVKQYLRNQYHQIHLIEKLRWHVINAIETSSESTTSLIKQLGQMYKQIEGSSWEIQYCWIKNIGNIIGVKLMALEAEIDLTQEQIKQLKAENILLSVNPYEFIINLDVSKLSISEPAKLLFNKMQSLRKLSELQLSLLKGSNQLPNFENYNLKFVDQDNKNINQMSSSQYFVNKFNNLQFDYYITLMEDTNEQISKSQSKICKLDLQIHNDFKQKANDLEQLYQAREIINELMTKLLNQNIFYIELSFIQKQWTKFIIHDVSYKDVKEELFAQQILLTYLQLIQNINGSGQLLRQVKLQTQTTGNEPKHPGKSDLFNNENLQQIQEKLSQQVNNLQIQAQISNGTDQVADLEIQIKKKKIAKLIGFQTLSVPNVEFAINQRLIQMSAAFEVNQCNIYTLIKIKASIRALIDLIEGCQNNAESQDAKYFIETIQNMLKIYVCELVMTCKSLPEELSELINKINTTEMDKVHRKYSPPSDDVMKTFYIQYYDQTNSNMPMKALVNLFAHFYEPLITMNIKMLSGKIIILSSILEQLFEFNTNQNNLKKQIVTFMKSIKLLDNQKFTEQVDCWKIFTEMIESFTKNPQLNDILNLQTQITKRQEALQQEYSKMLSFNPYDQEVTEQFQFEQNTLNDIQKLIMLVIQMINWQKTDGEIYINKMMSQMLLISNRQLQYSETIVQPDISQPIYCPPAQLQQYEESHIEFTKLIKVVQQYLQFMNNQLTIISEIQLACGEVEQHKEWLLDIENYNSEQFNKLCHYNIQNYEINESQLFCVDSQLKSEIMQIIQPEVKKKATYTEQLANIIQSDKWKIRECTVFQLLQFTNNCLKLDSKQCADIIILRMKIYETNKKVRTLLNHPSNLQQMNSILQQYWPSQQEVVISEIKSSLKVLNSLLYELQQEQDAEKRKKLQIEYQQKENEIQEQLSNVQEVGNALGITMLFIQDLKKDLAKIDQKINEIQENLSNMNADLQFLRGKTVYQLIDIRKNTILKNKRILDVKSIYIRIRCVEKRFQVDDEEGKRKEIKYDNATYLYNTEPTDNEGEINEFLSQDKNTMLIHGPAGSGKSTASRKIEEYFWELYEKTPSQEVRLVPIVIQLPSLQDPLYSALQETLKSDSYRFDVNQIRQLRDEIDKQKLKLLIIMDSYDELHQDYIGTNLIRTNKLSGWGHKNINHYPKVLVTTRSEVLNKSDYHEWFLAEESDDVKLYKEVRLEIFNKEQRDNYIDCYLNHSVKKVLIESYLLMVNSQNQFQTFENFIKLWNQIKLEFSKSQEEQLLSDQQIQYIEAQLVKDEHIQIQNAELLRNLRVGLQELKSGHFYKSTIQLINIEHILETPFMMEIVVQVLPSLIKLKSQPQYVMPHFINKFTQILNKQQQNPDNNEANYNEAINAWNQLVQDQTFMEDFSITMSQTRVKQKVHSAIQQSASIAQGNVTGELYQDYVDSLMGQQLTQYDFYNCFFEFYLEKQMSKLKEQGMAFDYFQLTNEIGRFAKNLAVQLSSWSKTSVEYKAQGLLYKKMNKSWEDEFFDDDCKEGQYKKMFRSCIPMKQQNNTYCFNHKSLQEFLVAKDFVDTMEYISIQVAPLQNATYYKDYVNQANCELITHFQNHFINQQSWSVDFMKGVCTFINQKCESMQMVIDLMFLAIELTRDSNMIMLGSNCLFLLQRMGQNFMDRNFQGINIKDIDLSATNFAYCNLDGSTMDNVTISGINVFKASLRKVIWTNMKVTQLRAMSYDLEIVKLHYPKQSKLIMISPDLITNEAGESIDNCNYQIVQTLIWTKNEKDYLIVQFDKQVASYDLNLYNKIGYTEFNHNIIKMKCNETHLFFLLDNADVIYLELPNINNYQKLEIKDSIQAIQSNQEIIKINNIWLARKQGDLAVYTNDLYTIQFYEESQNQAQRILQLTDQTHLKYSCVLQVGLINHQKLVQFKREPRLEVDLKVAAKLIYLHKNDKEFLVFTKVDIQLLNANNLVQKKLITHNLDMMKSKSLSLDNSMLVTLHENTVGIWNVKTFESIQVLQLKATSCAMNKEITVLALGYLNELQYQDLKSFSAQKQLNFKDVKFARYSQNFIGMTTDYELYYFNIDNHNEIKKNLLMKFNEMVYIYLSPNGARALISMQKEKRFITFDCLKGKQHESFGFCKSNVIEKENEDIMFIKGTQLYICQQQKNIATIVSPIKQTKEVNNVTYFKIVGDLISVTVNGSFLRYKLSKYTQNEVEETIFGNVTKCLTLGEQQLYIIDNKCVINQIGQQIYQNYANILDSCTINDQCLILLHINSIMLLRFKKQSKKSLQVRQQQIKITLKSQLIFAIRSYIITASGNTLIIYCTESLDIIDKIPLVGNINKMLLLNDNMIAITTDKPNIYVWDSVSLKILRELEGQQDVIADLSFNPNSNNLISRSVNNYFVCWNISRDECKYVYNCQYAVDLQKYQISQIVNRDKPYIYWIENNCIYRESLSSKFKGNTQMVLNLQIEYHTPTLFTISQSMVILCDTQNKLWISEDQCQTYTTLGGEAQQNGGNYNQLSISNDEKLFLTAQNSFQVCSIWSIKNKQQVHQLHQLPFNQIIQVNFLDQYDVLVLTQNNGIEMHIFNIYTNMKNIAGVLTNEMISANANINGFSIAHKDSSIDVYVRRKYFNSQRRCYMDRYVRQNVFNNSSNQPIQSYETDCIDGQIWSPENLSLLELFNHSQYFKINYQVRQKCAQQIFRQQPQTQKVQQGSYQPQTYQYVPQTQKVQQGSYLPQTQKVPYQQVPQTQRVQKASYQPYSQEVPQRSYQPQTYQYVPQTQKVQQASYQPQTQKVPQESYSPQLQEVPQRSYQPQTYHKVPQTQKAQQASYQPQTQKVQQVSYQPQTQKVPQESYSPQSQEVPQRSYQPQTYQYVPQTQKVQQASYQPYTQEVPQESYSPQSQEVPQRSYQPQTYQYVPQTQKVQQASFQPYTQEVPKGSYSPQIYQYVPQTQKVTQGQGYSTQTGKLPQGSYLPFTKNQVPQTSYLPVPETQQQFTQQQQTQQPQTQQYYPQAHKIQETGERQEQLLQSQQPNTQQPEQLYVQQSDTEQPNVQTCFVRYAKPQYQQSTLKQELETQQQQYQYSQEIQSQQPQLQPLKPQQVEQNPQPLTQQYPSQSRTQQLLERYSEQYEKPEIYYQQQDEVPQFYSSQQYEEPQFQGPPTFKAQLGFTHSSQQYYQPQEDHRLPNPVRNISDAYIYADESSR